MTLFTAIITPFNADGSLDEEGLRCIVRRQTEAGVAGVAALGSTGEASLLSDAERKRVLQIAGEECTHLMAGITHSATEQAVCNARNAEECGASSLLIAPPPYVKPTQEGIFRHVSKVAEATPLPVYIYNHPTRTGVNIHPETIVRLAEIPQVAGVKEASGNIAQIEALIEAFRNQRPDFKILSGDDAMTLPLRALGGHGVISVISNLFPEKMRALVERSIEEAREIHYALLPVMRALGLETNPIPLKYAMRAMGLPAGPLRLPLTPLSENHRNTIEKLIPRLTYA